MEVEVVLLVEAVFGLAAAVVLVAAATTTTSTWRWLWLWGRRHPRARDADYDDAAAEVIESGGLATYYCLSKRIIYGVWLGSTMAAVRMGGAHAHNIMLMLMVHRTRLGLHVVVEENCGELWREEKLW